MKKKLLIVSGITLVFVLTISLINLNGKKSAYVDAGKLNIPRSHHTATKLKDGRVLVVGGTTDLKVKKSLGLDNHFLKYAEIYDPKTMKFELVGKLKQARWNHSATLLKDGRVLITGGSSGNNKKQFGLSSSEIFDPKTNKFTPAGDLNIPRMYLNSNLLDDGRVLITGGWCVSKSEDDNCNVIAEVFEPSTNKFKIIGKMKEHRISHTSILLEDGRVLLAGGGKKGKDVFDGYISNVEVFDPLTNEFELIGNMTTKRKAATTILLKDGRVMIVAGVRARSDSGVLKSIEIYDPEKNEFREIKRETHVPRNNKVFKFDALRYRRALSDVFQIKDDTFVISEGDIDWVYDGKMEVLKLIDDRYFIRLGEYEDINRYGTSATFLDDNEILFIGGSYKPNNRAKNALILNIDDLLNNLDKY